MNENYPTYQIVRGFDGKILRNDLSSWSGALLMAATFTSKTGYIHWAIMEEDMNLPLEKEDVM